MVSPDFTPAAAPALRLPEISFGPLAPAALKSDAIPADRPNDGISSLQIVDGAR
jgi:hypothetical protein